LPDVMRMIGEARRKINSRAAGCYTFQNASDFLAIRGGGAPCRIAGAANP
jgi:hypothetical protein